MSNDGSIVIGKNINDINLIVSAYKGDDAMMRELCVLVRPPQLLCLVTGYKFGLLAC